jgi:hypothetical protein
MKHLSPVDLVNKNWCVISSSSNGETARLMSKKLDECSGNMGVKVGEPVFLEKNLRNQEDWIEFIRSLDLPEKITKFGLRVGVIILDRNSKHYYPAIKNLICTSIGLPTQVMLKENSTKNLSYYSGVLNQIQVKIGGRLFSIPMPGECNVR